METVNALELVRKKPSMFLWRDHADPDDLAGMILRDAITLGATKVLITRRETWRLVAADIDWLSIGHSMHVSELFSNMVPMGYGEVNASRKEILVNVFSERLATWTTSASEVEFFTGALDEEIISTFQDDISSSGLNIERAIIFQFIFRPKANQEYAMAKVRFYPVDHGGGRQNTNKDKFLCILEDGNRQVACNIFLGDRPPMQPGEEIDAIAQISHEPADLIFEIGQTFKLVGGPKRHYGEMTIKEVVYPSVDE